MIKFQLFSGFVLLLLTVACSKSSNEEKVVLFHGACQVHVEAQPEGAHIYVDGIGLSDTKASVNIPCGEKQIVVEKEGYQVFESYQTVSKELPLNVDVKLEKLKVQKNWAMSEEFIAQLENGLGPINEKNPEAKRIALLEQKKREEDGYQVVVPVASESEDSGQEEQNFEGIDFDDPATWM